MDKEGKSTINIGMIIAYSLIGIALGIVWFLMAR